MKIDCGATPGLAAKRPLCTKRQISHVWRKSCPIGLLYHPPSLFLPYLPRILLQFLFVSPDLVICSGMRRPCEIKDGGRKPERCPKSYWLLPFSLATHQRITKPKVLIRGYLLASLVTFKNHQCLDADIVRWATEMLLSCCGDNFLILILFIEKQYRKKKNGD